MIHPKPEVLTEDHLTYLDELRESGVTNMFGAASYLVRDFVMSEDEAKEILKYWNHTFSERHPR